MSDTNEKFLTVKNIDKIICEYCNREFAQNKNLRKHYERCKEKPIQTQKEQYDNQIQTLQNQLQTRIQQYEQQLQTQKEQYEREIQSLKEQLDEFKTQIFEIAKQPKQNTIHNNHSQNHTNIQNNHYNQYIELLAPMTLTSERVEQELAARDQDKLFKEQGTHGVLDFVTEILHDPETGKQMIVCVDISRNKYICVMDGKVVVDDGLLQTRSIFSDVIRKSLFHNGIRWSKLEPDNENHYWEKILNIRQYVENISNCKEFKNRFEKTKLQKQIKEQT